MGEPRPHWPSTLFPFAPKSLVRGNVTLRYIDEGAGEPVVCVHGNPTWSFYFRTLIARMRDRYRVIAPDHVGCGRSDQPAPRDYDYSLRSRIDDLEALLDRLGLDSRVTLVAHDWGGMIAAGVALRRPQRIVRLVMLNTAAFFPPGGKRLPWRLRVLRKNPRLAAALILGLNVFARMATRMAVVRPMPRAVRRAYVAPFDSWAHRWATLRFVMDIPLHATDPSHPLVREIDDGLAALRGRPMMLLWGLRDFVFDADYLAEWRRRFPEAEAHAFEDAGHYVLEDLGEHAVELIRQFLERHPLQSPTPVSARSDA